MRIFAKRGFTLIELLVVIAIIASLSAIIYASFNGARSASRDEKRVGDISSIQLSLEQYFNQNGQYPATLSVLVPTYIASIPTPPVGGPGTTGAYAYNYFPITQAGSGSSICTTYQLWTTFEASNSYLSAKRGFDSTASTVNECAGGPSGTAINASTTATALVYDVMPK